MKIPSSSSIFLAGLAISSSSSCLAAPTGDGTQDVSVTSSSSASCVSSAPQAYPTDTNAQQPSNTVAQRDANLPIHLNARAKPADVLSMVEGIPIVGPIISNMLGSLPQAKSLDAQDPGSNQDIDQQQLDALQNAIGEVTRIINNAAPSQVKGAAGTVNSTLPVSPPVNAQSNDDGSGTTANPSTSNTGMPPGPTDSAAEDSTDPNASNASAASSASSAAPPSPTLPGNPPNTPALPV